MAQMAREVHQRIRCEMMRASGVGLVRGGVRNMAQKLEVTFELGELGDGEIARINY